MPKFISLDSSVIQISVVKGLNVFRQLNFLVTSKHFPLVDQKPSIRIQLVVAESSRYGHFSGRVRCSGAHRR
jgi:hypothetical protein